MIIIIIIASIVKRGGEKKSGNDPGGIIGTGDAQVRIWAPKGNIHETLICFDGKNGGYTMATKNPYNSRNMKNK